jgi:hypothetical protein
VTPATPAGGWGEDTMPSLFDLTYYGLSVLMLGMLGYTAVAGFVLRHQLASPPARTEAVGVSLAALGALLTLVSGVVFTELDRAGLIGDVLYQQAHFSLFYVGFGLILYGVMAIGRRWRVVLWAGFAAALVIAAAFLFNPSSYTFTASGTHVHAVQLVVFYLTLFVVTVAGVFLLPFRAARSRAHPVWFALFCAAILMGLLRESTILPTLGDPELDVLIAFVPFALGSFFLLMTGRALAAESAPTKSEAVG